MKKKPTLTQAKKVNTLYQLHHSGQLLILPNVWDSLGAILLQDLGYPAVATASASVAFANGYDDGEHIPFEELLYVLKKIVNNVNIPVTADIESGYARTDLDLKNNILQLLDTGIAGINIEDTDKQTGALRLVEEQCNRIKLIKDACAETGRQLFINARTDVYLHNFTENKLEKTIQRGLAYKAAGADCFYPITMHDKKEIKQVVDAVQMPVNIIPVPGIPQLSELQNIGVARVSLGPSFLKIAIQAMKKLAVKLQQNEGVDDIIGNEVTSAYLHELVNKNKAEH